MLTTFSGTVSGQVRQVLLYLYTDEAFTALELDGENPPGVLSEVTTCTCAPFNQCDTKSCSGGIHMINATTLFVYQVDYNKL